MDLTPNPFSPPKKGVSIERKFGTRVKSQWYRGSKKELKTLLSGFNDEYALLSFISETSWQNLIGKKPTCRSYNKGNPITCDMPYYCLDCAKRMSYDKAADWAVKIMDAARIFRDESEYEKDENGIISLLPEYMDIYSVTYTFFQSDFANNPKRPDTYREMLNMAVSHAREVGYHAALFHAGISHKRPTYVHVHGIVITDRAIMRSSDFSCHQRLIYAQPQYLLQQVKEAVRYVLKYPVTDYFSEQHKDDKIFEEYIQCAEAFKASTPLRTMGALSNNYKPKDVTAKPSTPIEEPFIPVVRRIPHEELEKMFLCH